MTRIQKLAGIGALAVAFSSGTLSAATAVKPNIIVILADDLGYSDTEPFGGEIQTPNISSLAKEGIRFTQFYNCAKCSPSRASLLTGLYPQQVGMTALPKRAAKGGKMDRMTSRQSWELFNMRVDPSEVHNLAASKPELVQTLNAKWNAWAERVHADAESQTETNGKKTGGKQKEN